MNAIKNLKEHLGEKVQVQGFLESIRNQKNFIFLVLRDAGEKVQVFIAKYEVNPNLVNFINTISLESVVKVSGNLVSNPSVKLNGYEIIFEKIEIISQAKSPLPIDNNASLQERLDWRFLDLRKPENFLIFRVQTAMEMAMREFFIKNEFIEIHSPKLIVAASESGAELFSVDYFEGKAYLAQSPQFYKQMAMAAGFGNVFEIGPVFRANPSFTSRHDTEFTMVDAELSWIDSVEDVMSFEEQWLVYVVSQLKEKFAEEIKKLFGVEISVPTLPFPRIEMSEALHIVRETGHVIPSEYEGELDPEGEKIVYEYVRKNLNHEFMFITGYPSSIRPFYHMRNENGTTKSYDLLFKGMEITTGAQREHRVDILTNQVEEKKIPIESINFYLDFFRYGVPPHGGFGFGLTRFLMLLVGLKNVREVTFVYRGPKRLFP
jgi:nondiscriminating aspartyl-tRNA synthetase